MGDDSTGRRNVVDETLRALADAHRRAIVRYLIESEDGFATYEELVEHLQAVGFGGGSDQLLNALYHSHLPKLADAGLIKHDSRSETVRYPENEMVEGILDVIDDES